jgi:hypothetical protein
MKTYTDKKDLFTYVLLGISLVGAIVFYIAMVNLTLTTAAHQPNSIPEKSIIFYVNDIKYVEPVKPVINTIDAEPEVTEDDMASEETAYEESCNTVYTDDYNYGYEYETSGTQLTKDGGVNYYNGRIETWYSSNILYHYMTPEWNVGADGVYRDDDGYVIIASSDYGYGTVLETSFGASKVYDTGCASGVVDVYVNW